MITAAQLRAARGLLDWTRNDLAKAANISPETVKNIEHGTFRPQETTADSIVRAFAAHDVQFTANEGVQIKRDAVIRYEGDNGFREFMDDVYETAKQKESLIGGNKPICIGNVNDKYFGEHLGEFNLHHIKRMNEVEGLKINILIQQRPQTITDQEKKSGKSYREYRIHPHKLSGNVPYYVYGDKLAILSFDENSHVQVIVLQSSTVASAYRKEFFALWDIAEPISVITD